MVSAQANKWSVGARIDVNGHRGTIKYVGEVAETKGDWLGVDWDDPARGKHDGIHAGVSYFKARYPTSGSFIRPAKASVGSSCVDAIQKRYGLIEDHAGVDIHSLAQVQKDIGAKIFEFVGAEKINQKQSQFANLEVVSLRDQLIDSAGLPLALLRLSPNIKELDLSRTLINNWETVARIAQQLPNLRLLDISENRFNIPDAIEVESFDSVEHLVLTKTALTWEEVLKCCQSARNLKALQTPFNDIRHLVPADELLCKLSWLDLEGNPLESWAEINKLCTLKCLKMLNVSSCGIKEICLPSKKCTSGSPYFPSLQSLLVSDNLISDWNTISELDKLQSLVELKCLKNPLLDKENFETNHQIIIARITNLKVLNGLHVTLEERRGAELDYLKRHGAQWLQCKSNVEKEAFNGRHPCYQRIVDKYGPPEESEVKQPPNCLKSNLITVEFFAPSVTGKTFKKKLPQSMAIEKLSGLVQRLFDTGGIMPTLSLVHTDDVEVKLEDLKDLNYYSVTDGARISVRW